MTQMTGWQPIEDPSTVDRGRVCIPGHTSVLGTLTLTQTAVSADSAGSVELTGTGAGVHGDGLADDEAIADELADGLAGVGVGDLAHLIGIEPNLALAAAHHGGGQALLGAKVDPVKRETTRSAFLRFRIGWEGSPQQKEKFPKMGHFQALILGKNSIK
jgi:hypothetical protein